ncbi:hypothetical protein BDB00DRAFT_799540 [Zychaea mexicana]|uniref:uncharacterized protein n=1 Tax=Zychaea mexicana TaxID=64656 RepID=UPI0022FDD490|nr:uncharacterized protein BDB00DRAFT_799540 [Zychaea mexicana]KAI9498798.1 hypothetical protein BDB00DRAFT_799540 [Zychaea mexicana]
MQNYYVQVIWIPLSSLSFFYFFYFSYILFTFFLDIQLTSYESLFSNTSKHFFRFISTFISIHVFCCFYR